MVSRAWYDTIAQRAAIVRRWWRVRERSGESVLRTFRAIILSFRTRSTRTTKVTHFSGKNACARIRSNQVFHARLKTTTTTKGESKLGYGGRICRGPRYRIIPVTSVERCSEPFEIPFLLPLPPAPPSPSSFTPPSPSSSSFSRYLSELCGYSPPSLRLT